MKHVKKQNGDLVPFDPNKVRRWVHWSVSGLEDQIEKEYYILSETLKRMSDVVTTQEIHRIMIQVCLDREEVEYSRIAAKLELATIYKNQEHILGMLKPQTSDFSEYADIMETEGLWKGDWLDEVFANEELVNQWYIELEAVESEYWTVKQWMEKYSLKRNKNPLETPALGCLAIAIAYHGVTDLAYNVAKDLILCKLNLPTPALNGVRNGNFNSISCCLIEGGDSVESISVASHIAEEMTAKKAGIGITLETRSKGDAVKNGAVEHLGKAPLYRGIEVAVKKYLQESRGGSATITAKCIDPDIQSILLWKTQKIDITQRIDKVDYTFAYNDDFVEAVLNQDDWYLFSVADAPEIHNNFHAPNYMDYVKDALRRKVKHKKVKALEVLMLFLDARFETGRMYCLNLSEANKHTPFIDRIVQSNLCLEILLPTKQYVDMKDLYSTTVSQGETAFCSIAALNVANITVEEYPQVSERALRTVDRMMERAPMLTESMKESLLRRRSVAIGITGMASYLYKNGLDYDGSEESLRFVAALAERHYFYLLKASQKMSEETGFKVGGIKKNWLPIDTGKLMFEPKLDWESLRGKPRMHSVLCGNMPTESSAQFSSATNGVYPSRERVMYKQARTGVVQFISEYFTEDKLSAWEVDMVPYYGIIQGYNDQTTSADYYTDFTKYPNRKVPTEEAVTWFIRQAKAGVKTAYYQNFNDGSGDNDKINEEDCEGCKL